MRLAARAPYDPHGVLHWLATQAIPGVEECTGEEYRRVLRLPGGPGIVTLRPAPGHVHATFRLATLADLGAAVARCRRLLDLDADPQTYLPVLAADPALAPLAEAVPGLRLASGELVVDEGADRAAARRHGLPGDATGLARRARQWRPWRGYGACPLWPGR